MINKIRKLFGQEKQQKEITKPKSELPHEAQWYLAAIANLQNQNYPNALELFNRIIASDNYGIDAEQDAGFHYNRSIAKSNLHDFDGAFRDLHKSLSLFERSETNFEIFRLNHQLGTPQEGMPFLVRAYEMGHPSAEDILRNNSNYFNR